MKKYIWILIVLLLAAGVFLVPRLLHTDPAEPEAPVELEDLSAPEEIDPETEPVYVSDPMYGDHLTPEELEELREQDGGDNDSTGLIVTEEFEIELGETQATGGF